MNELYKKLVGKVDKETAAWLPLWAHLKDAAGVMEHLVEHQGRSYVS